MIEPNEPRRRRLGRALLERWIGQGRTSATALAVGLALAVLARTPVAGEEAAGGKDIPAADDEKSPPPVSSEESAKEEGAEAEGVAGARSSDKKPAESDAYEGISLGPLTIHGDLNQFYRFRKSYGDYDSDVYGYMGLRGEYLPQTDAERRAFSSLGFNIQASYTLDVDSFKDKGDPSTSDYYPFFDTSDTWADRIHGYLYEANLEAKDLFVFRDVKLGRQTLYVEESILFDGAYLETKRWNTLSFRAYGGVPEHLDESSREGDAMGGGGIESRPTRDLTLGGDYLYIKDDRDDSLAPGSPPASDAAEHLYRFYGKYDLSREWRLGASASWTGSRDRRQAIDLRYISEDFGLVGNLRAMRQNGIVDFQTNELSPYLYLEGSYAPYYQVMLDLYQPFLGDYGVGGGVNVRELEHDSDEGTYNHEFVNAYLSFDVKELWDGMRAMVRGDMWESDGDDVYAAGFELEQKVWILRIRAGTSYSLYRFDYFTGEEKNRDRVYYVKVRWNVTKNVAFDTEYQYEKDSDSEYHVALGGIRIWF